MAGLGVRVARAIVDRGTQAQRIGDDVVVGAGVLGADRTSFAGSNDIGSFTLFGEPAEIGYATTIGWSCVLVGPLSIGNYCQLAPHVLVYGGDHPLTRFSTYTGKRLLDGRLKNFMRRRPVQIGHGVWIGCNAVILSGAQVGNGAVIGAGAVVNSTVPPYSIVAGNPARVVRERIPADLAELVDRSEWWLLRPENHALLEELAEIDFAEQPQQARDALLTLLARLGRTAGAP